MGATSNSSSLQKIALVTGGAQGIGYACAEALVEEGVRVVLADIQQEAVMESAKKLGGDTLAYTCDMAEPEQIGDLFSKIEADAGVVTTLINNAGIALPGDFLETTVDNFRKVIDVNLIGAFCALQRAAKSMVENGVHGNVVNMSSINAQVAIPAIPAYCASKGGLMQLTKASSLALAPHGIRVNAVGPGSIDTEMLAGVNANQEAKKIALSRTPLQRWGTPREIADVVAFLASDKASYITGETIYVDGGRLGLNYTC